MYGFLMSLTHTLLWILYSLIMHAWLHTRTWWHWEHLEVECFPHQAHFMEVFSAALSCCCVPLMPIIDSLTDPALPQLPPSGAHLEFDQITRDGGEISLQARGECKPGI